MTTIGVTNMTLACLDNASQTVGAMQTTVDPWPAGTESLATTALQEVYRLRYALQKATGWTNWYKHPDALALTVDGAYLNHSMTWNAAGVTFGGAWRLNVSDTASGAASLLLDLQINGTSKFKVDKAGTVTVAGAGTFTNLSMTNNTNQIAMGTGTIGTQTMAALTGARTWTWPDITGTVFLAGGGQTVTSGIWNGTAVGTQYGGTGGNFSATAQGNLWYFSAAGVLSALAPGTSGFRLNTGGVGANPSWVSTAPTIQVFKVNGTYTRPAGLVSALIYCKGGGGSGGGSSSATANGGGGGEGEETWRLVTSAVLGASTTVTINAAAAGIAANTNASGNVGGSVTFGATLTAIGGSGGISGNNGGAGGQGGTGGSNSDWAMPGVYGQPGAGTAAGVTLQGAGGGKGGGTTNASATANSGGGGGGGTTALGSGAGGTGIVVVFEFY